MSARDAQSPGRPLGCPSVELSVASRRLEKSLLDAFSGVVFSARPLSLGLLAHSLLAARERYLLP